MYSTLKRRENTRRYNVEYTWFEFNSPQIGPCKKKRFFQKSPLCSCIEKRWMTTTRYWYFHFKCSKNKGNEDIKHLNFQGRCEWGKYIVNGKEKSIKYVALGISLHWYRTTFQLPCSSLPQGKKLLWHCVKSVQIRSFFWSVFSGIRTEYGDLRSKSAFSV